MSWANVPASITIPVTGAGLALLPSKGMLLLIAGMLRADNSAPECTLTSPVDATVSTLPPEMLAPLSITAPVALAMPASDGNAMVSVGFAGLTLSFTVMAAGLP